MLCSSRWYLIGPTFLFFSFLRLSIRCHSCIFHFCIFNPCHLLPHFPLLYFPPLLSSRNFSTPAFSTPASSAFPCRQSVISDLCKALSPDHGTLSRRLFWNSWPTPRWLPQTVAARNAPAGCYNKVWSSDCCRCRGCVRIMDMAVPRHIGSDMWNR